MSREFSENANNRLVKRVTHEIGELSAIMPNTIEFCFDVCTQGTVLEGTT
ncbi:MAG: hydrogenase/urease maturation nickel metallochaperone HypA [Trichodesmium sp. St5_bin2_1]|nr:hydrogenase/urease maturation nickel metallochaperone HypA [Trichodesmium sp. St5_bin2_1]MDE5083089.1 hydrogenase/urease maturation nickel metallochaperone HypA [Trichodesmium sp. St18_bin1]MDE5107157.1 hydrogenase/urease maturation nickel metallochaperone HypA [Trichodesmium sp. St17_bin3_1_1]MDE5123462.1 hydrogenase/urease maturation nickel metallochaperone HypA [Trichodesmium sp. St19_bin1]